MKNSSNKIILGFSLLVLTIVFAVPYFLNTHIAISATTDNVSGFAWSENIGWLSFNNTSDGSVQPYGVRVDTSTQVTGGIGIISGTTWSENIGWVSFDRAQTGNPPSAPFSGGGGAIAQVDWATGAVTGWMRALSACQNNNLDGSGNCTSSTAGDAAGSWDGWIKLSDESISTWAGNGVKITANKFSGGAWGSDVVGWVDFSPLISGIPVGPVVNTPPTASITDPSTDITLNQHTSTTMTGSGSDPDAGDSITGYEWRENSCTAGTLLSTLSSFSLTNPVAGTRNIFLRVQDSLGTWSTNCPSRQITVSTCTITAGNSCTSPANACGTTIQGTIQCDGSCSATVAPANPLLYEQPCISAPNICGQTSAGTYTCTSTCGAPPPPESACPPPVCPNNACEGWGATPETLITCPADCKAKVRQF